MEGAKNKKCICLDLRTILEIFFFNASREGESLIDPGISFLICYWSFCDLFIRAPARSPNLVMMDITYIVKHIINRLWG